MNSDLHYRLEQQYHQIEFLLHDLPLGFLTKRHRPEKWSIHENLAHLSSYQENFYNRIQRILQTENPSFSRFKAEEDPAFTSWLNIETFTIIEKTKQGREVLTNLLLQLQEIQLARTGVHPILGSMTIPKWVEFFLLHESHHFYTIFWLAQEFK